MSPSRFVASHVAALPKSGIRDFFAIVQRMKDAISLGIGEPDFVTPYNIREAGITALERGKTSYTDNRGLKSLREAIADYVAVNFDVSYDPESQIIATIGVSEALDIALRAIINPGDKVMYHEPCYVSYAPSILLCHGIPVPVATRAEDNFALNIDTLRAAWSPGCKALLINFPTNPTGGTADRALLTQIADFAKEKDILIISDEIYSELTYEGKHTSIASLPGMKERTLFLHGFSKAFAMTGFRMGYACGPADILDGMLKIHQYAIMCAPIMCQEAATEALRNAGDSVIRMRESYQQRRDYIVRKLNELGLECHLPRGAFYAFPRISGTGLDSMTFAKEFLNDQRVAIVPGTAFGPSGEGFCRASFSTGLGNIQEAMERLDKFMHGRLPEVLAEKGRTAGVSR